MSCSRSSARHRFRNTEQGWSKASTNRYLYRGHHLLGTLGQSGHVVMRFYCTAKTLTIKTKQGKVIGRETRRSRKP